jgi:hypothetical protein
LAKTTPGKVDAFTQTPNASAGKPAPPNSYSQLPGKASVGKAPAPSAEGTERGSVKGLPSGVLKHSPTENMQSRMDKGPKSAPGISTGNKDVIPSKVDKGFDQTP